MSTIFSTKDQPKHPRENHAFSIPIVLFFLVILTIMTVFLLQIARVNRLSTQSYAATLKAEQLGQGAIEFIVNDFIRELTDERMSDVMPPPSTATQANQFNLYRPKTTWDMLPKAWATNNDGRNAGASVTLSEAEKILLDGIVRTSSAAAYPRDEYADAAGKFPVPLSLPSRTENATSFKKWNQIALLKNDSPTQEAFEKIAPGWVILTRNGPKQFLSWNSDLNNKSSSDFAIGRFAYVVYDVGGRLDANWAGYSKNGSNKPQDLDIARKGHVALADLTEVGLTNAQIQNLFEWRTANQVNNAASANDWIKSLFGEHFLSNGTPDTTKPNWAAEGYTNIPSGYNAFLNRQDFLKFAEKQGFLNNSLNSARFFTLHSMEKNAPAFFPTYDAPQLAGSNDTVSQRYRTLSLDPTSGGSFDWKRVRNLHLGTARRRDGRLLMQERFPLSRLSIFAESSPSSATMLSHFGLAWENTTKTWEYQSVDGIPSAAAGRGPFAVRQVKAAPEQSAPANWPSSIFVADNRELDFFEVINATVLWGSTHTDGRNNPVYGSTDRNGSASPTIGKNAVSTAGLLTLKIGASIIDQADSDSFPTAVSYPWVVSSTSGFGSARRQTFGGQESLPYLSELMFKPIRPSNADPNVLGLLCFELWNPHQNATSINQSNGSYPQRLRVVPISGTPQLSITPDPATPPAPISPKADNRDFTASPASVELALPFSASEPTLLNPSNSSVQDTEPYSSPPSSVSGIIFAEIDAPDINLPSAGPVSRNWAAVSSGSLKLEMQYLRNGAWHPYQQLYAAVIPGAASQTNTTTVRYINSSGTTTNGTVSFTKPEWNWGSLQRFDPRGSWGGFANLGYNFNIPASFSSTPGFSTFWSLSPLQTLRVRGDGAALALGGRSAKMLPGDLEPGFPAPSSSAIFSPYGGDPSLANIYYGTPLASPSSQTFAFVENTPNGNYPERSHYIDYDGVVRRAMGNIDQGTIPTLPVSGNSNVLRSRPILLNRAFRSTGELGYASRDQPWKNVDFWSANSADSGLLESFSVADGSKVSARINLNSAPKEVLAAVCSGVGLQGMDLESNPLVPLSQASSSQANVWANDIFTLVRDSQASSDTSNLLERGPFWHKGELVTRLGQIREDQIDANYSPVPAERQALIRALSDTSQTRTWNLVIDVIAQSGNFTPNAIDLNQFTVQSEKRYWIHLAIDRFTGEILNQSVETVLQ